MRFSKLCLLPILLLTASALLGQIQKGDHLFTHNAPANGISNNLAGISAQFDPSSALLLFTPNYGWAVNERIVLGGTSIIGFGTEGVGTFISLAPYLRYHFVNNEKLLLYGQFSGSFIYESFDENSSTTYQIIPSVGLSFPLAEDIWVGPSLGYSFGEFENQLGLGFSTFLVLGPNNRPDNVVVPFFGKGSWTIGTNLGSLGLRTDNESSRDRFSIRIAPDVQYFLTNRLAAGLRASYLWDENDFFETRNIGLGLGARFYLSQAGKLRWFASGSANYFTQLNRSNLPFQVSRNLCLTTGISISASG
ncbi:MAG: hypothetical protein AAF433_07425 [Bacteroidota bacterium]